MAPDEHYTHGHHESVLRSHNWRTIANSAAYLAPRLTEGCRVLDVGCGPGTITAEMADLVGPSGSVTGMDASAEVVELAASAHARPNLTFVVGDVYAIDAADGTYDVVHAHQVLQHLADPVAALVEMHRVCRPGGVVAARDADYRGMSWYPEPPAMDRWLELYQQITRRNGGEPDAARLLLTWAHRAGFTEATASASVWCFATPDERTWWANLWADRITESQLAEQALREGFATASELDEIADAWRAWASDPGSWFAVLHGEILATA
jgi:ubiquinone/menaquinone biosynthesis C-methylase UbiE